MYQLILQDNLSEVITYPDPSFLIRSYRGDLSDYISRYVPTHWHREIELIYIDHGSAVYHVNETKNILHKGDAIFVNSNSVHYGYGLAGQDFTYSILQFPPEFIDNKRIRSRFLERLLKLSGSSFVLSASSPEHKALLFDLLELIELNLKKPDYFELQTLSLFYRFLECLDRLLVDHPETGSQQNGASIATLQKMLTFIQNHYDEPIRLEDIATAGTMCRSKCCSLFRDFLQQSPMEFTTNYRIQKSVRLLIDTDLSITEIAGKCGFNSQSYFIETFRKAVGCSPGKYRSRYFEEGSN